MKLAVSLIYTVCRLESGILFSTVYRFYSSKGEDRFPGRGVRYGGQAERVSFQKRVSRGKYAGRVGIGQLFVPRNVTSSCDQVDGEIRGH